MGDIEPVKEDVNNMAMDGEAATNDVDLDE